MAVPEGFESATRLRDTFVTQSTQAAINVTDPLSQVATALATIEPTLQKFIVKKIDEKKDEEVAAGQAKGQEAGRTYTKTEKLLFPQNVEIDETSEEYANSLVALRKNQTGIDTEILRGKSLWYKNAYQEAKAITLGKNFAVELKTNYETYRVPDSVTGELKPLSAYPYQSPEVQNYISSFRNKNVEAANIDEFYFNRSFLPQIEKGVKDFAKEHSTDHSYYKLEEYSKQLKENLGLTWTAIQFKTAKFGDDANFDEEAKDILDIVQNISKLYQAEDQAKIYDEVVIPWIMERGLLMASNETMGEERFDLAKNFIRNFANLFPRKAKTRTVINKKGQMEIKPVMKQLFEEDGKTPVIDEKGKAVFVPEYFDQNVLQTKKNYEKKLNTAIKAINALEVQYQKTGKEKDKQKDINEMKDLLKKGKTMSDEERLRIKELASKSTTAMTWLKNNRDTYNPNTQTTYFQLLGELRNGHIRDERYALTRISEWFESTLKLPEDESNKEKLLGMIDDEINEEKKYALAGAKQIIATKNLLLQTLPDKVRDDAILMDKLSDEINAIIPYMENYVLTKKVFEGEETPRYPNQREIDQELQNRKEVMDINLLAIQKFSSGGTGTNLSLDPLSPQNIKRNKEINVERVTFVLQNLNSKQDYVDGKRLKPSIEDLDNAYDYQVGEDVNFGFIMGQYMDEDGKIRDKDLFLKLLDNLDLTNDEIKQYGLLEKYKEIEGVFKGSYQDLDKRMKQYEIDTTPPEPPEVVNPRLDDEGNPDGSGNRFDQLTKEEKLEVNKILGKEVFTEEDIENVKVETSEDNNQFIDDSEDTDQENIKEDDTPKIIQKEEEDSTKTKVKSRKDLNLSQLMNNSLLNVAMPPIGGLKEGDLIASADIDYPVDSDVNDKLKYDMYLDKYYGITRNSREYKSLPNYMKYNLYTDYQALDKEETEKLGENLEESETTTTGDFIDANDLSEVRSDIPSNLGLRDGSLIAMALPFKGKKEKQQQDKKVEISKEPNAILRMETNFKTIYALAKEVGIKFPEVLAAQFGAESDHGLHVTGKNNYFGIKATQAEIDAGQSTLAPTFEEIDGKKVRVMAHFKNFNSIRESIEHYKKFWNDDFQDRKGLVNVNTAEEAIIRLKENKYATDSDYVKLVTDVLNDARREPPLF